MRLALGTAGTERGAVINQVSCSPLTMNKSHVFFLSVMNKAILFDYLPFQFDLPMVWRECHSYSNLAPLQVTRPE